jgi:hypothetical protein
LTGGTLYHVRAFATNTAGTSYGNEVTFTTLSPPTVTTQAVSGIGGTTATGNGNLTDLGVPNPTAHGVVWSTTLNPTTANNVSDLGAASATGAFTAPITGLTGGTLYHVRAFATNTDGTSYGADVTFTTIVNTAVTIGGSGVPGSPYSIASGQEQQYNYPISSGPVTVANSGSAKNVASIRLQSFANNTLYSYIETPGIPQGLLSYKYYFPTYNNTWGPLNSQLRFANINNTDITVKVTIGTSSWTYPVAANSDRREYLPVSGGPVIIESTDPSKKIIAAIRLQSYGNNTLYSFAETLGIPAEQLSYKYYFPTYNNTWGPLNSQLRFANINNTDITVKVTIGANSWTYPVAANSDRREYLPVSGGPVIIESTDPSKNIIAAIRLQSLDAATNTLYSFVETMGVPVGLLSYKYDFPNYNNTWTPLNSQLRFSNINNTDITVKVTIGTSSWTYPVAANSDRREYLPVSGGPVIIESTDPTKQIIAAIRLQSLDAATNTLYSFAETMGVPAEQLSSTNYFSTYNNTWTPLNSQLRFAVP